MLNKIKEFFKKIMAWLRSLLRKTDIDNRALELLLNKAMELFIEDFRNKAYRSFKSFANDFKALIIECIRKSDNKVDDMLEFFIKQAFDIVMSEFENVFNKDNLEVSLINLKSLILNEYKEWENKK